MIPFIVLFILIALVSTQGAKNVLACGIFGYAGTPEFPGDMSKITLLGMQNDARGGNGCGLFHDGSLYKSVSPPKIADFLKNKRFPAPSKHFSVFGHCRRATVGAHVEGNTHPFAVKRGAKTVLVGMHNGTIANWETLCKDVGIDDHTEIEVDSLGLLTVLANAKKGNFDVLSHYIGGAALAWVYTSSPSTTFLFHGESKSYPSSTFVSEERPLFIWDTSVAWNEDTKEFEETGLKGVYFSSTKDSLVMIGALEKEVLSLPTNEVWKVEKGVLIKVASIDRSEAAQNKSAISSNFNYAETTYGYSNAGFSGTGASNSRARSYLPAATSSSVVGVKLPDPNLFIKYQGKYDMPELLYQDYIPVEKQDEGQIVYSRGLYWRGEYLMHSRIPLYRFGADKQPIMVDVPFYVEPDGTVLFHTEGEARKMEPSFFYRGFLCNSLEAYNKLVQKVETNQVMWSADYASCIHPSTFSVYNDQTHLNTQNSLARVRDSREVAGALVTSTTANGVLEPPFSGRKYTFNYGKLVSITKEIMEEDVAADKEMTALIEQDLEEIQIEFKTRVEEMHDLYKDVEGAADLLIKLAHLNKELNEL